MTKKLYTPKFRVSYPKLFKPVLNDQSGVLEYTVVALFKKGEDLSALQAAVDAKLAEQFKTADKKKWPKNIKSPFRDQEEREKDGKLPAGHEAGAMFVTLKSYQKPGVVDKDVQPIIDPNEFYPGCWAKATVNVSYYGDKSEHKGNKGTSFWLNNIQKLGEGEPLGNTKADPTDDFAPVADNADDLMN